ncbi:hypothetical protein [Pseudomonas yamanorum]|uniref:Uncharacterized protein n=1 Tax=Pseudomonas yamanorum TaxID=515393 RepID=A0A7Y8FF34_9PSED|nr:hypothetical protein [Pseudomonas yamanorum]NWE77823.1 hypothetical protein [Pseudomonas yamanorum]
MPRQNLSALLDKQLEQRWIADHLAGLFNDRCICTRLSSSAWADTSACVSLPTSTACLHPAPRKQSQGNERR